MLKFLYRMLENPGVYEFVQKLLGGERIFSSVKQAIGLELKHISYRRVLEVGCGTGLTRDCFSGAYTGVDINPEYIRTVAARGEGTFLVADATALPFEPHSYDLVATLGVLHHLDQDHRARMLQEMRRVCRPSGHILIVDGLVPSNRLNLVGYVLAKLDRGRYKMRIEGFQQMIETAYRHQFSITVKRYTTFPAEFAVAVIGRKAENSA